MQSLAGFLILTFIPSAVMVFIVMRRRLHFRLKAKHPSKPWMWHPTWSKGYAASEDGLALKIAWLVSFLLILFCVAFGREIIASWSNISAGGSLQFIAISLCAVLVFSGTMYLYLHARKFGKTKFYFQEPGFIGGELRGELVMAYRFQSSIIADVTLENIRSVYRGSGKNRSRSDQVLFTSTAKSLCLMSVAESRFPVSFAIPSTGVVSTGVKDDVIKWVLTVHIELPGVDFYSNYEVPVFSVQVT